MEATTEIRKVVNMLTPETINNFLAKIQLAEEQLSSDKFPSHLYHMEASFTLAQLKRVLLSSHLRSSAKLSVLTTILAKRWQCIQSTNLAYLHDFTNPANIVCMEVARELGKLYKKSYLTFLMPSLAAIKASDYISSSYEDDLDLKDIVLSDDSTHIISVSDTLSNAREDGTLKHNSLFAGRVKVLSFTEEARVLSRHLTVKEYYDALQARVNFKLYGDTVGAALNRLIKGLRAGGEHSKEKHGGGESLDSGYAANVAIIEFSAYLETLDPETRSTLMAAKKTDRYFSRVSIESISMAQIWGRLTRPADAEYTNTIYCVENIANYLEEILEENPGLYDLVSFKGEATINLAKLEADVVKTADAMSKGLATVEKHACYHEKKDDEFCLELYKLLMGGYSYQLSVADIVFIANYYATAYVKNDNKELLAQSERVLNNIARFQPASIIVQALKEMTAEGKHHFMRLTEFKVPEVNASFFSGRKRRAAEAELAELDELPVPDRDFSYSNSN